MICTQRYISPLGGILLAADEAGLTGLWFDGQKYFARGLPARHSEQDTPALLAARRLLFLDEPAAAMDAEGVERLYSLLREEKQRGVTVVLVTHSARSLEGADRVLWMDHRPRFLGAPQELARAGYSLEGGSDHGNLG